ncbi:MAG: hypothetical protein UV38_C0002G0127 [candidate division TM6 bacterium GW2011_GWE2_42_60]|nr:MAG: hypothetical protein UV38_C0002G0127 [candidate division TM6 bacterium GW2011_GWE2_42_60]HBY06115.1 hypothetical protein [Candidatus Dependentiae bacterium]
MTKQWVNALAVLCSLLALFNLKPDEFTDVAIAFEKLVQPFSIEQKEIAKRYLVKSKRIREACSEEILEKFDGNNLQALSEEEQTTLAQVVQGEVETYLKDADKSFSKKTLELFENILKADTETQVKDDLSGTTLEDCLNLFYASNYFLLPRFITNTIAKHICLPQFIDSMATKLADKDPLIDKPEFTDFLQTLNHFSTILIESGTKEYKKGPAIAFARSGKNYAFENLEKNEIQTQLVHSKHSLKNYNGPAEQIFFKNDLFLIVKDKEKNFASYSIKSPNRITKLPISQHAPFKNIFSVPREYFVLVLYDDGALESISITTGGTSDVIKKNSDPSITSLEPTISPLQPLNIFEISFIAGFSNGSVENITRSGAPHVHKKTLPHKHNSAVTTITTQNISGEIYATASEDGTVIVSTDASAEKQITLTSPDPIFTMQFNPIDKNELLIATTKNVVTLWNFSNPNKVFKKFEIALESPLISILFTQQMIIVASKGKSISLFNTETGALMGWLNYKGNISSLAIDDTKGSLLASFSKGGVVLYDLNAMLAYYSELAQKTFEKKLQKKSELPSTLTVEKDSPLVALHNYLKKGSALTQKFSIQ